MESEFPLFPYLTGQIYQLFGVHEWIGRGLSVLFSALTIWLVIRLGRRWFNPAAGWWGGMALAVAPLGVYYGRVFKRRRCCCSVQQQRWKPTAFGLNDEPPGHSL